MGKRESRYSWPFGRIGGINQTTFWTYQGKGVYSGTCVGSAGKGQQIER